MYVGYEIIIFEPLIIHYPIIANIANDAILPTKLPTVLTSPFFALRAKNLISTDTNQRTAKMIFSPAENLCPYINSETGSRNPILINSALTHS